MALDISFLLSDPVFCAAFSVERCAETVDDMGRAQLAREALPWRGVIQPATPRELERLPEGDRDRETITVYSREPLRVGQRPEGSGPDVILWQGQRYEVASVEPWPGYVRALATLLPEAASASAVATQEATDEDSNSLTRMSFNATTVAIRKARGLANGWRATKEATDEDSN